MLKNEFLIFILRATGLAVGLIGEVLPKILVEVLLYVCFIEN
jgi:hypothetical protein